MDHELIDILRRLEALRASMKEPAELHGRLISHIDQAAAHLYQAAEELAESKAKSENADLEHDEISADWPATQF